MKRLAAALLLFALPALALAQDPCAPMEKHFNGLVDRYVAAGRAAIDRDGPENALENARREVFSGKREATVTVVGIGLAMRPRADLFQLSSLRQICGFADRNNHPLHVAACGYFNAINPLGNAEEKRLAVEREITRFSELTDALARDSALAEAMKSLEACIAVTPLRPSN
jgi:hypothetical protein